MRGAAVPRPERLGVVVFGVLVVATLGAFFLSNRLKSQPSVLFGIRLNSFVSPNGDGVRDTLSIAFTIDKSGTAAVDIVDADGTRVRRITDDLKMHAKQRVALTWDGKLDDGKVAPDGKYQMRLVLKRDGSAVLAPKPFLVDTTPPSPAAYVSEDTPIVKPGQPVTFRVRGTSTATRPTFSILRTDTQPVVGVRRFAGDLGDRKTYTWDGLTDAGKPAAPGTYMVAVSTRDAAGNLGQAPKLPLRAGAIAGRPGVTIRALAVQPPVRPVRAGDVTSVRVDAREHAYRWNLRRVGVRKPVLSGREDAGKTTLVLRPPRGPSGLYLLEVSSNGATTRVPLAVQARAPAGPLIVLPMISWLGRDPVDSTRDGLPDVLKDGTAVRFPRPFAYPGGLPTGLASEIAPLLVYLDRAGVTYDLTTDLALDFGDEPTAQRKGVLFAGSPTWISRQLARRLRTYVGEGGRVATFGPDALRASVTVGDAVLSRPTPVTAEDALGGRIADVRTTKAPSLTVLAEDAGLGLLEGFSGELGGFSAVEELESPGRGKVVTSVGEETTKLRPALSATDQGEGLVIRVGLPGWVEHLEAHDGTVEQLTRNIVDILRGAKPRVRQVR